MAYFDNAATTYPKPDEVYSFMDSFYRTHGGYCAGADHSVTLDTHGRCAEHAFFVDGVGMRHEHVAFFCADVHLNGEEVAALFKSLASDGEAFFECKVSHKVSHPVQLGFVVSGSLKAAYIPEEIYVFLQIGLDILKNLFHRAAPPLVLRRLYSPATLL